jgi:uncharacterized protein (TIGR00255 family)
MLRSMTGYAAASGRGGNTAVLVTVKSVNHRFLDLHLRLPPELDPLEAKVRQKVREMVGRGHIDLTVVLERDAGVEAHIDRALVSAYMEAYNRLRHDFGVTAEADLNSVLKVPGVLSFTPANLAAAESEEIESLVLGTLADALRRMDEMRAQEARTIAGELRGRVESIARAVEEIEQLRGGAQNIYLQRLRERVGELLGESISPERLAQEAALLVDRSDVSEELLRMKSHVQQFQRLLTAEEEAREAGKRLDFLLQEMNRESNTVLSKTSGLAEAGIRIANLGLHIKAEIEKLREQVQNLQ